MKARTKVLAMAGVVAVAASVLWRPVAEPRIVAFPSHLDRTLHYTGTFTAYVDPSTGATLPTPTSQPLTVDRHLHTVAGGGPHTVVVRQTLTFHIGSQVQTELDQYVMDRRTMQNVRSPLAWAIVPSQVTDRSGTYNINLPMGANTRTTYRVWKDEAGAPLSSLPDPTVPSRVAHVATTGFKGTLAPNPVVPAWRAQLAAQGLPGQLSAAQAQAQLAAKGVDLASATRALAAALPPAELGEVTAALSVPVHLQYLWGVSLSAAVNPTTGALVEVPSETDTLFVQPSTGAITRLAPVLAAHAQAPGIAQLQRQLQAVVQAPPQPVYRLAFGETAASAASTAKTVRHQLFLLRTVRTSVPWGLGALGAVLLAATAVTALRPRRPRRSTVPAPCGPVEHQPSQRAA